MGLDLRLGDTALETKGDERMMNFSGAAFCRGRCPGVSVDKFEVTMNGGLACVQAVLWVVLMRDSVEIDVCTV